jgi:hypothetical protein
MDKEHARFILSSFRPDGADVADPDFAAALTLAMENRELGEWLASQRAFDAAFAQALGSIDLPEHLREDLLACLAAERGDFPQAEDSSDAAWIGALASIKPPASLRADILWAMEQTATPAAAPVISSRFSFRKFAIPMAAAAGIALAFFMTRSPNTGIAANGQSLPVGVVQASFVKTFTSPSFDLEKKASDHAALIRDLRARNLPCCDHLPPGLMNAKGIGCRELVINGKRGSLLCFQTTSHGIVHMIVFRRSDVSGDFPEMEQALFAQTQGWESARWSHGDQICLVMSPRQETTPLSTLF